MTGRFVVTALVLLPLGALSAQFTAHEYQGRRDALVKLIPAADGIIVAFGAREPVEDYVTFYQSPTFTYLTGWVEPDAALIIAGKDGGSSSTIFVQPRDPAREVWTGSRPGTRGAEHRTGLPSRAADELPAALDSIAALGLRMFVVGDFPGNRVGSDAGRLTLDEQLVLGLQRRHPALEVKVANALVEQLRGSKTPGELAMIKKAVDITVMAQREAMRSIKPGMNEFEVQALIEYTFRRNGADRPSFASIVGSGPNATTLHYSSDDRFIDATDIVVMDIGASYKGYAADVTRSIPANGVYSPPQRDIYQTVRDAQAAGERQARSGAPARAMDDSASATLAAGLARLGLIESPTATYDCGPIVGESRMAKCPQFRLFYMHGLGHGIGLEVHDPDQYYRTGTIAPGSAFTIEPGIYVRSDVLDVLPDTPDNRAMAVKLRPAVQRYRNIGVRIEDDYMVTDSGVEWLSRAPREMSEIEALMKTVSSGPAKRNAALVDSYRQLVP